MEARPLDIIYMPSLYLSNSQDQKKVKYHAFQIEDFRFDFDKKNPVCQTDTG